MTAVTDHERYLFDLQGFLVVPGAIDAETLAVLNAIVDRMVAALDAQAPALQIGERSGGGDVLRWGKPFVDLIDNPRITPYLEAFVHPDFRLDHEYFQLLRPRAGAPESLSSSYLHGGGTPFDPAQSYRFRDGRIWSGLTVVAYSLRDVHPGDGGLAVVPGSHKANYRLDEALERLDGELPPWVRAVTGPAGTAVIFTEAQTHGTLPWHGAGERRTLLYKFSPHPLSWSWRYYEAGDYGDLTPRQRRILEPPNGRSPIRPGA